MSAIKFKVRGMRVEMWKTSFRVEGMASTIQLEYDITQEKVTELLSAIFDFVQDKAKRAAVDEIKDNMAEALEKTFFGENER